MTGTTRNIVIENQGGAARGISRRRVETAIQVLPFDLQGGAGPLDQGVEQGRPETLPDIRVARKIELYNVRLELVTKGEMLLQFSGAILAPVGFVRTGDGFAAQHRKTAEPAHLESPVSGVVNYGQLAPGSGGQFQDQPLTKR